MSAPASPQPPTLRVVCSQCQAAFQCPAKLAGKKIRCTRCQNVMAVPPAAAPGQEPVMDVLPADPGSAAVQHLPRAVALLPLNGGPARAAAPSVARQAPAAQTSWVPWVIAGSIGGVVLLLTVVIVCLAAITMIGQRANETFVTVGNSLGGPMTVRENPPIRPLPGDDDPDIVPPVRPRPPEEEPPAPAVQFPPLPAPLPIKPPTLDKEEVVVRLPVPAVAVAVGGGGRYLLLHLQADRQIALFDVVEAKIVHVFPTPDEEVRIAAGMNHLLVAVPNSRVISRWNLATRQREGTMTVGSKGAISGIWMGSASDGPLLVCARSNDGFARSDTGSFVDVPTLKELPIATQRKGRLPDMAGQLVRVSANGRVFAWRDSTGSEGHGMTILSLDNGRAVVQTKHLGDYLLVPGPDGRFIFGCSGLITSRFDQVFPQPAGKRWPDPYLPAHHGPYFMQLLSSDFDRPRDDAGRVVFYLQGANEEITRLQNVPGITGTNLVYGNIPDRLTYDQRVHYLPAAKLLITIPRGNDRLILRRFDIEEALEKSGKNYLLVTSEPPATARRGEVWTYQIAVKSKAGNVGYRLDASPPGMSVSPAGQLTWNVPANFAADETDVIVVVSDKAGQERIHSFKLRMDR